MEWFIAVVVVAILGVAAVAAAGGMGEMAKEPVRDTFRQDLPTDRALQAADIQSLRFGVTLRGYAMNQVDDLLDRLTREIAERDETIRRLSPSEAEPAAEAGSPTTGLEAAASPEVGQVASRVPEERG